jgi:predicted  nucleic acid-binding Zn-ribbon protein
MISKTIIDLLEEENIKLTVYDQPGNIDDTFVSKSVDDSSVTPEPKTPANILTREKLQILEWVFIDKQLRSYGSNRIDDLTLNLIDEESRGHISQSSNSGSNHRTFDFRADSIPFAVKYNIAIALSYSEAIDTLSSDVCEVYASREIEEIFIKYGLDIRPGLNRVDFSKLPTAMKKELIWPMVQNLYRALMVRKAAQTFPEGVPGKLVYEALECKIENDQLVSQSPPANALSYFDSETVYFSELSDLELKYRLAVYCLNNVGDIKPKREPSEEETRNEDEQKQQAEEQQQSENIKKIEEEYIAAFKRINKSKSFWDNINLEDIFEMGKDVISAIKEEIKNFSRLKQDIISRLAGCSKVSIENEELIRIMRGQNPDFAFASKYISMFLQPSDYYSLLGLDSSGKVTEKEVKDAFKRLAKIYHPDKNSNDPNKEEKERTFKLLITAKDALLKQIKSGKETPSSFRSDVSPVSYLGNISKLFDDYIVTGYNGENGEKGVNVMEDIDDYHDEFTPGYDTNGEQNEIKPIQNSDGDKGKIDMESDKNYDQNRPDEQQYIGPYFEEMRILGSMIDRWSDKSVLVIGVGREPEAFSIPVILSQMGAEVYAIDINYRGPAEYEGCKFFRLSADRIGDMFEEEQFDVVISTAMFGVPFTNWAIREYHLNSFDENLKDRIKELELLTISELLKITKKGGVHFHYNRDLNPQSWTFDEEDLKYIGCESAFHSEKLANFMETWFLKK